MKNEGHRATVEEARLSYSCECLKSFFAAFVVLIDEIHPLPTSNASYAATTR